MLALQPGRPLRLVLTLEETFQAVRSPTFEITARTGFPTTATITFQDIVVNGLLGAYADIGYRVVSKSSYLACGPYRVPDARIKVRAVLSHTPPATALRGFGSPQMAWAFESQMDAAARRLGIDRLEIRLRNLAGKGEEIVRGAGDTPADGEWAESVTKAAEWIGWGKPLPEGHGRGIALGIKSSATTGASYAIVRLLGDGSVDGLGRHIGHGPGGADGSGADRREGAGRADRAGRGGHGRHVGAPYDMQTSASRSTVFMGTAVLNACREIKAKLRGWRPTYSMRRIRSRTGDGAGRRDASCRWPSCWLCVRADARRGDRHWASGAATTGRSPARRQRGVLRVLRDGLRGSRRPRDG